MDQQNLAQLVALASLVAELARDIDIVINILEAQLARRKPLASRLALAGDPAASHKPAPVWPT